MRTKSPLVCEPRRMSIKNQGRENSISPLNKHGFKTQRWSRKQTPITSDGEVTSEGQNGTRSTGPHTQIGSKHMSDVEKNIKSKERNSNMFKNHRSLAAENSSWTGSGIGFSKADNSKKKTSPGLPKYEKKESQICKKYAPILVLEMQDNNEYEFKDSSFQNELIKKQK